MKLALITVGTPTNSCQPSKERFKRALNVATTGSNPGWGTYFHIQKEGLRSKSAKYLNM